MKLVYYPQDGWGVMHTEKPFAYDQAYFDNFKRLGETRTGWMLNQARLQLVRKYWRKDLVDVGVGAGTFLELARNDQAIGEGIVWGYDVAGPSRKQLLERNDFQDPWKTKFGAVTCWDSYEHMLPVRARALLDNVGEMIFLSLPIFESGDAILDSHHFKPGEHILYFTERGLIGWMFDRGFKLLERNRMEEAYGRSGIGTYVFYRCS